MVRAVLFVAISGFLLSDVLAHLSGSGGCLCTPPLIAPCGCAGAAPVLVVPQITLPPLPKLEPLPLWPSLCAGSIGCGCGLPSPQFGYGGK
uniref:Hydrophobin n=1 Tax=Angiostrongylus cantonensis TaxID=6313 RepID=A0A0K0DBY8_ANGCA